MEILGFFYFFFGGESTFLVQCEKQQDALRWVKGSYIDAVIPMNYTTNDTYWNFELDQWKIDGIQSGKN